jgi:hypothetical protein
VRNIYIILFGKPEGKSPLRRLRCRWKDNIRIDLKVISLEGVDWIRMAQDRDQWQAGSIKGEGFLGEHLLTFEGLRLVGWSVGRSVGRLTYLLTYLLRVGRCGLVASDSG